MTVSLHLGVADMPYGGSEEGTTTGEVAAILEERYQVIETFYDRHGDAVADALRDAMAGALESRLSGAPVNNPFAGGETRIEEMFRKYLSDREVEQPARGIRPYTIPTMAAVLGVSHRFKGKKSGGRRPSFVDTGLYQSSFRAWVD